MKAAISSSPRSRFSRHESIREWAKNVSCKLREVSQELFRYLAGKTELKIHKIVNSQGVTYWRIYDPVTQRQVTLDSEQEARIWIENRYNNLL